MLNKLKSLFSKPVEKSEPVVQETAAPALKKVAKKKPATKSKKTRATQSNNIDGFLSEKQRATAAGEPYISILKVDIDPENINSGSFELDWNDKFVLNLVRAGYKIRENDTDNDIVDRWFQTVCRNIALEVYEQQSADLTARANSDVRQVQRRDLGDGRTEIS